MSKFCGNCGNELKEGQRFCSRCGREVSLNVNNSNDNQQFNMHQNYYNNVNSIPKPPYHTYKLIIGIIMIFLGFCLLSAGLSSYEEGALLIYTIPGGLGLAAGIMTICSRTKYNLLMPSGIIFIVSAVVNFFGIIDISIYAILALVFGILNISFSKKNNNM